MAQTPDDVIITGPSFIETPIAKLRVTPHGSTQTTLGQVLATLATSVVTDAVNTWTEAQRGAPVVLTDGAAISINLNDGNNFELTLYGDHMLATPTNVVAGQAGQIVVTQGSPGGWNLTYDTIWKFPSGVQPALTSTVNAVDILSYYVISSAEIAVCTVLNFK